MKKSLIFSSFLAIVFLAACSSNESGSAHESTAVTTPSGESQTSADTAMAEESNSTAAEVQKGKSLIQTMDCVGCHKEQGRIVGPSYAEIAAKYESNDENINSLASKIISGGSGVWGEVAMSPHPTLSKDDARAMVKYILSVK